MKKMKFYTITVVFAVFLLTLSACPPLEEDGNIDDLQGAVIIPVTGSLDGDDWITLLENISKNKKRVRLDLSECTVPENESGDTARILKRVHDDGSDYDSSSGKTGDYICFNPLPNIELGKNLIVSIILPDVAEMIAHSVRMDFDYNKEIDQYVTDTSAFRHFDNLRYITGKRIEIIGNFAFINNKSLKEVNFPNVHHITQGAFYGCTALEEVIFNVALNISIRSFENCKKLKTVYIPTIGVEAGSMGLIDQGAFKNCESLTNVYFPYVKKIDPEAFYGCSSLTEVVFPAVTKIGNEAFRNCTKLKRAVFHANPKHTNADHPLEPWLSALLSGTPLPAGADPFNEESVAFYDNAFRGCKSLNELDVRYAWNVFFATGSLADIGEHLDLYLYDDEGGSSGKCYGHPQLDRYFGGEGNGLVTLKSIRLSLPWADPPDDSKVLNENGNAPGYPGIKIDIDSRYNKPHDTIEVIIVKRASVTPEPAP
jgi:hypothetical protein